jgi:hypothetical protein
MGNTLIDRATYYIPYIRDSSFFVVYPPYTPAYFTYDVYSYVVVYEPINPSDPFSVRAGRPRMQHAI